MATTQPILLRVKWGVSRAEATYGYNLCTLYADGKKVARCNGGGYDMRGTVLGDYVARAFAKKLLRLREKDMPETWEWSFKDKKTTCHGRRLYGLSFHNPNFNPGKAIIGLDCLDRCVSDKSMEGKTVEEAEAEHKSFGLERYQAFHKASSPVPTRKHRIPQIDGGCGFRCVEDILNAIGLSLQFVETETYLLRGATRKERVRWRERLNKLHL